MSVSLSRFLVATDFSPSSVRALHYADVMAERFRAELHVLHVVMEPLAIPAGEGAWIGPDEALPQLMREAETRMEAMLASEPLTCGVAPIRAIEVGYPIEQIQKYCEDQSIDMLVVGTHGHRGFSRFLLGSVAEKLVRLSKCPVLTVHADASH